MIRRLWASLRGASKTPTEGSMYYINANAKLEAACALIRKAYELAGDGA